MKSILARSLFKTYGRINAVDGIDLNVDEGELTPTLKIRRKQINENWAKEIEAMYSD